jgi:FOG: WD40 repeat
VAAVLSFYSWRLGHQLAATSSARQAEGDARKLAELHLWDSHLAEIRAGRGSQQIGRRTESLATVDRANELLQAIGRTPERVLQLRNATIATLALPDLREERIVATTPGVTRLGLSVAADRYVGYGDGEVTVHRLSNGELLCRIPRIPQDPLGDPNSIELGISASGRYISITSSRGVKMWRCDGDQSMLVGAWPGATHAAFTPDSKYATVCHPADGVLLIDLFTFHRLKQLLQLEATARPAFHAASRRIAICTSSGVSILDWTTGQVVSELPAETRGGLGIDWHPSGDALVVSGLNDGVAMWNVAERRLLTYFPHRGYITRPHFSHDGNYLLTPDDWSRELRLWNTGTAQEILRSSAIHQFAADSSGSPEDLLVQLRPDGQVLWRIVPGLLTHPLLEEQFDSPGDALGIAINPEGRLLAIGRSGGFEVWDLATCRGVFHRGSQSCLPAFEPDGDLLMACSAGLYRWPLHVSAATGGRSHQTGVYRFGPPETLSGPLADNILSTSRDGSLAVVRAQEGWQLISLDRQRPTVPVPCYKDVRGASISPNNAWLALANWEEDGVSIWDTLSGQQITELSAGRFGKPLFSPDGRWLATTPDGVRLWHVADWKPGPEFHAQGITLGGLAIAFSPDSQVLAVSQPEETTRLVDSETGRDWAELLRSDQRNSISIAFTPDHSRLIEAPSLRGSPRVWNLSRIREELEQRDLDWPADVLTVRRRADSGAPLWAKTLALEEGDTTSRQAAAELIERAGDGKDAQAKALLEQAVRLDPGSAHAHNHLAWLLVAGPQSLRDAPKAVSLAHRAVELDASHAYYWNTLGVALYRDAQYSEAITILNQSLERGGDSIAGFNLIFLALCHSRLGDTMVADDYYQRAKTWQERHLSRLSPLWQEELTSFFAEAKDVGLPKDAPTK